MCGIMFEKQLYEVIYNYHENKSENGNTLPSSISNL